LANPASIHCQEQGGTLEMRQDESGGTYGVCVYSDGTECEEREYFNGDCQPGMYQQAEKGLAYINLVQEAGLMNTVAMDIFELNREPADEPYAHLLTITDEESLDAIVEALNVAIRPELRLACIPIYQLYFHLADGTTHELEYSCGDNQRVFMRGGQPLIEGEDYMPPPAFNELMGRHIQSTWASNINPTRTYRLDQAVQLEILESVITESKSNEPHIVTAQVVSRLKTDDPTLFAPLVAMLDVDYEFTNNMRCPAQYIISFTFNDGTVESFGYLCRDGESVKLRGDQAIWRGRAIETPAEFRVQLEDLLIGEN
jgi:hypothetical protein